MNIRQVASWILLLGLKNRPVADVKVPVPENKLELPNALRRSTLSFALPFPLTDKEPQWHPDILLLPQGRH